MSLALLLLVFGLLRLTLGRGVATRAEMRI